MTAALRFGPADPEIGALGAEKSGEARHSRGRSSVHISFPRGSTELIIYTCRNDLTRTWSPGLWASSANSLRQRGEKSPKELEKRGQPDVECLTAIHVEWQRKQVAV